MGVLYEELGVPAIEVIGEIGFIGKLGYPSLCRLYVGSCGFHHIIEPTASGKRQGYGDHDKGDHHASHDSSHHPLPY